MPDDYAVDQLTGIGASEQHVVAGFNAVHSEHPNADVPWNWGEAEMKSMSSAIRSELFPISVAANKADLAMSGSWIPLAEMIRSEGGVLVATSAEAELALSRASQAGLIEHSIGESDFEITPEGEARLSQTQREALTSITESLVWEGGGLVGLLSEVVFGTLSHRVAYPVQDETQWVDGDGNILPDALLVAEGTTAKGLAYAVHSDLGDGFIRAVDARSSRVIGAEYEVQDGDVISIYAKT